MKNRTIILLTALTMLSFTSVSQTVKENIDKQMKDPKTAENAAKADVYIQKRNADSILIQPALSEKKNKKRNTAGKTGMFSKNIFQNIYNTV